MPISIKLLETDKHGNIKMDLTESFFGQDLSKIFF